MTGYILFGLSIGVVGLLTTKLKEKNDVIEILEYDREHLFNQLHEK
ncbi:hypothetical protein I6J35_07880 [Staphylococcus condimenti]|uniref:Phage protein n=1 Tax=Staphylococcus condimenti TaxID=70255 RepID=A0AB37H0A6_9STAP|nr:hypothetical protein [Staphylococcus condimenti]MDK8646302.1 hypothetical protein [Staphylococcus condimenti]QQS82953.1 hypothetical protein I6J05_01145 [Staphylococcus condimenti]QRP94612.1 hypothetical protein I6J35_07880 [Staphylococcus condimenti]VEG64835.1 Uncharacterised protein [Staphylococcus condimenti]